MYDLFDGGCAMFDPAELRYVMRRLRCPQYITLFVVSFPCLSCVVLFVVRDTLGWLDHWGLGV